MAYRFSDFFWEGNGFDELRRYMKNGTEFCKEFETVLAERAELENSFVKGMLKIIKKAKHSSKRCVGSLEPCWEKLVATLEAEGEAHKNLANSLSADCAKALKTFTDQQIKQREPMEGAVEKQHKSYTDKLSKQMKNKRVAFKSCRDMESNWDQLQDLRGTRGGSDKDVHKQEKVCRKMEDSLMKADREYRDSNLKTEMCRLGWENAMYQCCKSNEQLEQERLQQVQSLLSNYSELLEASMPPVQTACQDLVDSAGEISPEADLQFACETYGTGPNQPEQLLLTCYEEDMKNTMDSERRQTSLERKIQYVEQEIERQQKARTGVEQLAKVYQEQPDFVDEKGADDVNRQLIEADSMLNLLKANHYKLLCSHAEISNAPSPSSQFGEFINTTTDKHGQSVCKLKIPLDQIGFLQDDYQPAGYEHSSSSIRRASSTKASMSLPSGSSYNGGGAYGGGGDEDRVEEGFDDDDEYDDDEQGNDGGGYVGQCEVLYPYEANESDELTIRTGDVINIVDKYDVEWWQGELDGIVGIFPASYVKDMS